jgi:hypothetical protein
MQPRCTRGLTRGVDHVDEFAKARAGAGWTPVWLLVEIHGALGGVDEGS